MDVARLNEEDDLQLYEEDESRDGAAQLNALNSGDDDESWGAWEELKPLRHWPGHEAYANEFSNNVPETIKPDMLGQIEQLLRRAVLGRRHSRRWVAKGDVIKGRRRAPEERVAVPEEQVNGCALLRRRVQGAVVREGAYAVDHMRGSDSRGGRRRRGGGERRVWRCGRGGHRRIDRDFNVATQHSSRSARAWESVLPLVIITLGAFLRVTAVVVAVVVRHASSKKCG